MSETFLSPLSQQEYTGFDFLALACFTLFTFLNKNYSLRKRPVFEEPTQRQYDISNLPQDTAKEVLKSKCDIMYLYYAQIKGKCVCHLDVIWLICSWLFPQESSLPWYLKLFPKSLFLLEDKSRNSVTFQLCRPVASCDFVRAGLSQRSSGDSRGLSAIDGLLGSLSKTFKYWFSFVRV